MPLSYPRLPRRRPFRVGRSRTGLGLFAIGLIKKRMVIVEYRGRKIPDAEAEKLEPQFVKGRDSPVVAYRIGHEPERNASP